MRICRVAKSWPSEDGVLSAGLHAFHLTQQLGLPTLVVTSRVDRVLRRPSQACEIVQVRYPGGRAHAGRIESLLGLGWRKFWEVSGFLTHGLTSALRYRPQLVHVHSPSHIPLALAIKARLGSPIIVTLHGTDVHHLERFPVLRNALRYADRVLCISPHMLAIAKSVLPSDRVHYVGNGVDLELFRDRGLTREKRIITVAAFKWAKGHQHLMEALPQVFRAHPDARCLLVGEGSRRAEIKAMAQEKGLVDKIDFVPRMDREGIAEAFANSRVMVLPSVSEGLPGVLLEAMACGTPSVVTDVSCCREIVGEGGIVVPPKDSGALADAVARVLSDTDLAEHLAREGSRRAQDHSWQAVAERVLRVYGEVTREPMVAGDAPSNSKSDREARSGQEGEDQLRGVPR